MASEMMDMPLMNPNYLYLLAANIGAVIMPWMIFYCTFDVSTLFFQKYG
jgi:Mn2+/Fe2+ NRAMP family transporter